MSDKPSTKNSNVQEAALAQEKHEVDSTSFGPDDVVVLRKDTVFQGFFRVAEYELKHQLFAGEWSQPIVREIFDRGESAALLLYDPLLDNVILVEQFRTAAIQQLNYVKSPWLLEVVAGMVDKDRTPEEVVIAEAKEEANCKVDELFPICHYLVSPGGTSELIHLFLGTTKSENAGGVYGLASENEDIKVHVVKRDLAYEWTKTGRIVNAVTIMALQWLELNRNSLFSNKIEE
ncbi:MAG: NUDIX domain-containing protein [Pseudomonadota bacterium]